MRRDTLLRTVGIIENDLQESNIQQMLDNIAINFQRGNTTKDGSFNTEIDLSVITSYITRVSSYDSDTHSAISILDIDNAGLPEFWQSQIKEPDPPSIFSLRSKIKAATNFLPRFAELLKREYGTNTNYDDSARSTTDGVEIQTVILSDEGDALSSPTRLIELLQSMREIYAAVAEIESLPIDGIAVVGLDSGSEKSFDFLGVARVMSEIRALLQFLYTTVAMHRQNITIKNLAVMAEAIPLIQKLDKLKHDNVVDEESASRIRHNLLSNLERFSSVGAYTPEMRKVRDTSPALVMRPQPRLLTGPAIRLANETSADNPVTPSQKDESLDTEVVANDQPEFTAEELAAAVNLLKMAKLQPKSSPRTRKKPTRKRPPEK